MQDPVAGVKNLSSQSSAPVSQPQQAGRVMEPPMVSLNKEHGPVIVGHSEMPKVSPEVSVTEIVSSHIPEVAIPQELKTVLKSGPDNKDIKLDEDIQKVGVSLAKESTPVITTPTGIVRLPMTYKEAMQKEKKSKIWEGIHWMAAQVMYQWCKYDPDVVREVKKNKAPSK